MKTPTEKLEKPAPATSAQWARELFRAPPPLDELEAATQDCRPETPDGRRERKVR